jgi:hypothetical protein
VETDGKGFDKVRGYEIGKKHFKLTHFEEVIWCYSPFQLAADCSPIFSLILSLMLPHLGVEKRFSRPIIGWSGFIS